MLFDGGIRSGQDVMRALALGAKGCLIGRAYIYGLGAGGQAGVARAIEIIRKELDVTMALTGVKTIAEIDEAFLWIEGRVCRWWTPPADAAATPAGHDARKRPVSSLSPPSAATPSAAPVPRAPDRPSRPAAN